jgi:hypothetical protein
VQAGTRRKPVDATVRPIVAPRFPTRRVSRRCRDDALP